MRDTARGDAPTLVPVASGAGVKAEILVLQDDVNLQDARDILWRRETRRTGHYGSPAHPGPNDVLARELNNFEGVAIVLHTDFVPEGKIVVPDAKTLAMRAVQSVRRATPTHDGITYLIDAKASGIVTQLTSAYEAEISA